MNPSRESAMGFAFPTDAAIMNFVWLVRYISLVFVFLATLASITTFHPDLHLFGSVLPVVFGLLALAGFLLAQHFSRRPADHWVHRLYPIQVGLALASATVLLLLISIS